MKRATAQPRPKLPAFGREIADLRRRGLVPAVQRNGQACRRVVVALDTWNHGKDYVRVVVTPEHDPAALDFSFLAGLDVELVWLPRVTDKERRDALIRALLACNPERLLMWIVGDPTRLVWLKSKTVGIELAEYA